MKKQNYYLCGDCGNRIKEWQENCKHCWAELVWENEQEKFEENITKNKDKKNFLINLFKDKIIPRSILIIVICFFLRTIGKLLIVAWDILESILSDVIKYSRLLRPIWIILVVLFILYLIIKFIKRARNN